MDLQSNLAMMEEDIEFEEKVDILPTKPKELAEIEINDIKQERHEEEYQLAAFESDHDSGEKFKLLKLKILLRILQAEN